MKYSYHKPDPLLSSFIQTVLVVNGDAGIKSSDLPLFSNGMPALLYRTDNVSSQHTDNTSSYQTNNISSQQIVNASSYQTINASLYQRDNGSLHQLTIYGDSIPDEKWNIGDNTTLIAFLFRPFSIAPLFKIAAKDLKGQAVELPLWNAQKSMALRLQLIHSRSTEEQIQVLNHFLISQLEVNKKECEIIQYATDRLMQNSDPEVLKEILSTLHLTDRTFQRIFKRYTGITANQYRRICQFYFAFSQLKGNHFEKQSDIAYSNNYFDQSHYIRSFKEFTDTTPNDYLQFGLNKKGK